VLTSPAHPNGTSRLAEAARVLALSNDTLVVNVQGDEPEIEAGAIDAVVHRCDLADMATIASPMMPGEDPTNPNIVKVVVSSDGWALYFSRALIPHHRDPGVAAAQPLRHVGLYAYRSAFLQRYAAMTPTPLEQTEVLEQLRVLEHGGRIAVAVYACSSQGIDTPEQYEAFVARWRRSAR